MKTKIPAVFTLKYSPTNTVQLPIDMPVKHNVPEGTDKTNLHSLKAKNDSKIFSISTWRRNSESFCIYAI